VEPLVFNVLKLVLLPIFMPTAFEEITRNPIYLATESLITLFNKCRSTLGFFDEIALLVLTKLDMDFLIDGQISSFCADQYEGEG
jgi:hypothetical protein